MAIRRKPTAISDYDELVTATGIKIRYAPRGASLTVFHTQDDEVLLAGPAGTGKSRACLEKMHLAMSKHKGAKAFMARKTRQSMTNSCIDMFERHVLKPIDRVTFHTTNQQYNYPNGSLIAVVGFDDPERIKSTDWDMGYVQEATELTENDWEIATTRLRNWVLDYQQIIADCNPDKPSHWLKKRCDAGLTIMLPSFHKDNPRLWHEKMMGDPKCHRCVAKMREPHWTTQGEKYLSKLDHLSGARRARLYQGLWIAAEGLVYPSWDENIHRINFNQLPEDWDTWAHYWSIDWGFKHPFVWCDFVEHPYTKQLIRVREIYTHLKLVEDLARYIRSITEHYAPRAIICDHDAEDRAVFERHSGYPTLPAYKYIQPGIQAVQSRLDPKWCNEGPGLLYCRDAVIDVEGKIRGDKATLKDSGLPTSTEEEYDGYVWDERHNRLVNSKKDELPIDKDNHGMDNSRYQVAFHDDLAIDPDEFEEVVTLGEAETISPY